MADKRLGLIVAALAVLYLIFTAFVARHGVHPFNSAVTVLILVAALYLIWKRS